MRHSGGQTAIASGEWRKWKREAAIVWRVGISRLVPRFWIILTAIALGAGFILMDTGLDQSLLAQVRFAGNPSADAAADFLSTYSDLNLCLPLTLILWTVGAMTNRRKLRHLALACLMATLMAGAIVITFRCTLGRPRPKAELADGFYGPHFRDSDYQGFPSGHCGTTFGTGTSILAAVPIVGVPAAIYAGAVAWSRMQKRRHHPTDVTVGAVIGTTCGLSFGSAVPGARLRLRRKRKRRTGRKQK